MIDNAKLTEILNNIKISESDEAFQGAMPKGDCVLVSVATEPKSFDGNNWYPVTFKTAQGNYDLSLKGLLQAEGLNYSSRNLSDRIKIWYSLDETGKTAAGRKFKYSGKKEREITYRKEVTIDGVKKHPGEKGTMKYHSFETKLVG